MNFDEQIKKMIADGARKEIARERAWTRYAMEEIAGGKCKECGQRVKDIDSHMEFVHGGKQKTLFEEAFGDQYQVSGGHDELTPRRYPNSKQPNGELGDELNLTQNFTEAIAEEDMITADKPDEMMNDSWREVDNKKHQTMSLENKDEGTFYTHDGSSELDFGGPSPICGCGGT